MNYIIEDDIDFFKELNTICQELSNNTNTNTDTDNNNQNTDNLCLIGNNKLETNYITLGCCHKFNYLSLFKELCNQKKINRLETYRVRENEIKCPYCRTITENILPNFITYNLPLVFGVNYPEKYALEIHLCSYKFKTGKVKNTCCNKSAFESELGILCNKHYKMTTNKNNNKNVIIKDVSTNKVIDFANIHKYCIPELKDFLKAHRLQISGNKSKLIERLVEYYQKM